MVSQYPTRACVVISKGGLPAALAGQWALHGSPMDADLFNCELNFAGGHTLPVMDRTDRRGKRERRGRGQGSNLSVAFASRHMDDPGAKDESPHSALYTLQHATAFAVHTAASVPRLFRSGGRDIALWSSRHYVLHGRLWQSIT